LHILTEVREERKKVKIKLWSNRRKRNERMKERKKEGKNWKKNEWGTETTKQRRNMYYDANTEYILY
jgi:hypothetical protein